jgi:tetrapyrrole methylase family protein/MazG family protein
MELLTDPDRTVIARTMHHPAMVELSGMREVMACDDLYEAGATFDDVYMAIADRVLAAAASGPVTYAVPGSALVGERAAALIRDRAEASEIAVTLHAGESFLELALAAAGIDPIRDGIQVVDGRSLPDPLPHHLPTLVTQVDTPLVAAEVSVVLGKVLPDAFEVLLLDRLGDSDQVVEAMSVAALATANVGPRTSVFVPAAAVGWHGLVQTNRRLRAECPWDREQTHHSLLSHLIEEAYETVDAMAHLPADAPAGAPDLGAYAEVEEELGDLLLQVVFHATLARESGAFDVEEIAEGIRRKLVRRHPHVFGDVAVDGPAEVLANWESLKTAEKARQSLMDDIPPMLPGIARADKIQKRAATAGFDWPGPDPVYAKVDEELAELRGAQGPEQRIDELGDLLFAVVNLARHLGVDPELALARANDKFAGRFRSLEEAVAAVGGDLRRMTLAELDTVWDRVKQVQ